MNSPRSATRGIIWGGDDTINTIRQSPIPPRAEVKTVNKLLTYCKFAAGQECCLTMGNDCRITRVGLKRPDRTILENIGNSGFYEIDITEPGEILSLCTWELQTISCIGYDVDELRWSLPCCASV